MIGKRAFSSAEAAVYIDVSPYTLKISRSACADRLAFKGPRYIQHHKGGRVIYLQPDLDAWLKANGDTRSKRGRPRKGQSKRAG